MAKIDAPTGVDAITSGIQGVTITKGVKKPAFIPFLTKVDDIFLVRPVYIDGEQFIKFDVCGDGIKAVCWPQTA